MTGSPGVDGVAPTPTTLQYMILRGMAAGHTIATVARTCKIGERTAYRHLDELAKRIGVASRAELLVEAVHRRWLDQGSRESSGASPVVICPD